MNARCTLSCIMRLATMNIFRCILRAASALRPTWNESSAQVANADERWNRSIRITHLLKSRFHIEFLCQVLKPTAFVWLSHLLSTFLSVKTLRVSFLSSARHDEP